jgi:hypothetical protein
MNRSELQNHLVQQIIDGMDMQTLVGLCYDYLMESYDKYSDGELITEVREYYPELLEDVTV